VLLAVVAGMCQAQEDPPKILRSPDGAYAVRMVDKPAPGADPVMDFFTLEVLRGDTTIARVPTYGYLVGAHWSPDGTMVAVIQPSRQHRRLRLGLRARRRTGAQTGRRQDWQGMGKGRLQGHGQRR
jgi:hypothetical protein